MNAPITKPTLPRDEWDFRELQGVSKALLSECLEYELAREVARAVPEIGKAANRLRRNPNLVGPISTLAGRCLCYAKHWLDVCPGYPETPWLAHWRAQGKPTAPAHPKTAPMRPVAFERGSLVDLAGKPSRRIYPLRLGFGNVEDLPEIPQRDYNFPLEVAVFKIDWRCTNEEILADVQRWLNSPGNRPKDLTNKPGPVRNDPRDVLQWLGTYRLRQSGLTAQQILASEARIGSKKTIYTEAGNAKDLIAQRQRFSGMV